MSEKPWELLLSSHSFDERTLAETLIGGQAFRWFWEPLDKTWTGIWEKNVVRLRLEENGLFVQRLTRTSQEEILEYLALDRLGDLISALPCNADPVLEKLRGDWSGLTLLNQPVEETLLGFICSSNKQILQIRQMLHLLSKRFGSSIAGTPFNALPSWKKLVQVDEEELRTCALGYRARHIAGTAAFLRDHPGHLESIHDLPLPEARAALQELPGVGPKVAECVLLFGYGRMNAFPVDTWIAKLMERHYPPLAGWSRPQIATFACLHFGRAAGLAQQWLFADRGTYSLDGLDKFRIPRD